MSVLAVSCSLGQYQTCPTHLGVARFSFLWAWSLQLLWFWRVENPEGKGERGRQKPHPTRALHGYVSIDTLESRMKAFDLI